MVYRDKRDARSLAADRAKVLHIDRAVTQALLETSSEIIVPHFADQPHPAPKSRCGHGLVGAFAAVKAIKTVTPHSLARRGNLSRGTHQVEVHATDDED